MTLKEAYKILGASKHDDDREIKAKYKKLDYPEVEARAFITKAETVRSGSRMHVKIDLTIPRSLKDTPAVNGSLIKALLN